MEEPFLESPGLYYNNTHYILYEINDILTTENDNNTNTSNNNSNNSNNCSNLVICIHGIGSFYKHYNYLINDLKLNSYKVLCYDLIGRGYSKLPNLIQREDGTSIFDENGHIEQLRELLEYLNLTSKPYHLIGHSMGGAIASLYANKYSNEIASLTLLSPAGLMNLHVVKFLRSCRCLHGCVRSMLQNGQEKAWRDDFYNHNTEIENESLEIMRNIYSIHPEVFEGFWLSVLNFPLYGLDESINSLGKNHHIKILLLWGRNDLAVPFSPCFDNWVNTFKRNNHPSIETKVYDNASHGFFIEYHEVVNKDILQFLSQF